MTTGRRVHERYALELPVTLIHTSADGQSVEVRGKTSNVSLGGALVSVSDTIAFGSAVKVRVTLPPLKEQTEMPATVRWIAPGAVGVQFGSLRAKEVWALNQMFKDANPA